MTLLKDVITSLLYEQNAEILAEYGCTHVNLRPL